MVATRFVYRPQKFFGPFTAEKAVHWAPSLAIWGASAGAAITLFLSSTPVFYRNILQPLPYFDEYYRDTVPESDKP